MFSTYLENVREKSPLIHNITNYVTVNDVANSLLAVGGSPIMADDPDDAEEITAICNGLNINIGTLNQRTIKAMFRAGARTCELNHALLLDPVGAGASSLRTNTALNLMKKIKFDVIKGNASEIKTFALNSKTLKLSAIKILSHVRKILTVRKISCQVQAKLTVSMLIKPTLSLRIISRSWSSL